MAIKLTKAEAQDLHRWLGIAGSQAALPLETEDDWATWVTMPVVQYNLAPRQAKAALVLMGILSNHGASTVAVLEGIIGQWVEEWE